MEKRKKRMTASIIVLFTYLLMVTVNALANILPINGIGTGEISDSYPNLFAPAGVTFAIWGVIYMLLLGHSIYQLVKAEKLFNDENYKWVGFWFSISSIVNTIWIFTWHYEIIWLSLLLMLMILISLIKINMKLRNIQLNTVDTLFVKLPFAVYFAWITVATIANVTTFLVSIEWDGFGLSEVVWTNIMILLGAIIGVAAILYFKSISYGMVIIWAYLGIYIKHTSADFFAKQYPSVLVSVLVSIGMVTATCVLVLGPKLKKRRTKNA